MVAAVMDKRKIPFLKRKGSASNKKDIKKFELRGWEKNRLLLTKGNGLTRIFSRINQKRPMTNEK